MATTVATGGDMKKLLLPISLMLAPALLNAQGQAPVEAEHLKASSQEFTSSRTSALKKLRQDGFTAQLLEVGLGAATSDQLRTAAARIKAGAKLQDVAVGDPAVTYDVIIQPGHYGRTAGRTGASGAMVSEQAIVAYLVGATAARLRADGLKVIVVPADNVVAKSAKVFLAVHAEGSEARCHAGPSLAYKAGISPYAMHAVGLGVSRAMGYAYGQFRADNYTKNESDYYMYKQVDAERLNGLLEIGEITCPAEEQKLVLNADRIANNLALALEYIMRLD